MNRDNSILVYRSVSEDPYTNLALEDWMYENLNLTANERVLFLWRNKPTVVIGRHQNPWKECNLELLKSSSTNFVRRKSGGGTVYHDLGNINCTFFTSRASYDRKSNLAFLAKFLQDSYNFNVSLNARDDLILDAKYKISGTAAKLGLKQAYHHCTLLCKVDTAQLSSALQPSYSGIFSNATRSVKSETKNLFETSNYDWQEITSKLAEAFVIQSQASTIATNWKKHAMDIDPKMHDCAEDVFNKKEEFLNWDWNYGKTPKFVYTVEEKFLFGKAKIILTINKGLIVQSEIEYKECKENSLVSKLLSELHGVRFDRTDVLITFCDVLASGTSTKSSYEEKVLKEVSECVTTSMH